GAVGHVQTSVRSKNPKANSRSLTAANRRLFEIAAKLPDCFQKLHVRCVPQTAAVQVGAQFADGRNQLPEAHFRHNFRHRFQGACQLDSGFFLAHNRSFPRGDRTRLRRYRPITMTGTVSPGANLASRSARVTPSAISIRPAGSSYTNSGGIPSLDA